MISSVDEFHLKCDYVDCSIVNGIREQVLFSFKLSAPQGNTIVNNPTTVSLKKDKEIKIRQDSIFPGRLQPKHSRFQKRDTHIHSSN